MKIISFIVLSIMLSFGALAADTLKVSFNKSSYVQGDDINWQCELAHYTRADNAITLQLWVENLQTGQTWKYRYPLINGYAEGTLNIANEIPDGKYAFNFLLQRDFFNIKGVIKQYNPKDTFVNYMIVSHDKKTILDKARLTKAKTFEIRNLLFEDTALFMFSAHMKRNDGELWMDLKTSLDSAFKPAAVLTKILVVGAADTFTRSKIAAIPDRNYSFDFESKEKNLLLPEFVVKGQKKHIEDFVKDNVSPMFKGIDDVTFDGLDDPEISESIDVYTFLLGKVAGLTVEQDPQTGDKTLMWRNAPVAIYVNEFQLDPNVPLVVNPSEVAMIKVFRPGFEPGNISSAGGVVAIYTKVGNYEDNVTTHKNVFHIRGYDPLKTVWKP